MDNSSRYKLYKDDIDSKKKIGLAYIIVNQTFHHRKYSNREGAYKDYQNMKKIFKPLGFKLYTFVDKKAKEMKAILSKASKRPDLKDFSCFVCVISSHGEEGPTVSIHGDTRVQEHVIIGSDGMPLRTQEIINMFREEECNLPPDTPKLFFLQACRENVYERDRSKALDDGADIEIVQQYLKKRTSKRKVRKNYPDSSDARPSNPEDEALSEQMRTAEIKEGSGNDVDLGEEEELDPDDEYVTDTTDDDSEDEYREKRETKITQLTEQEIDEDLCKEQDSSVPEVTGVDKADAGKRTNRVNTDVRPRPPPQIDVTGIPCHKDMLVMFASPPGKLAWRSTDEGGWLLVNLYFVVKCYIQNNRISQRDFLSILTEVAHAVSFWETNTGKESTSGKKMIPVVHHQLTKEIVFKIVKTPGLLSRLISSAKETLHI